MVRLICMLFLFLSCSDKSESVNLIEMYKQVIVSEDFIIVTTEKQRFNSNLYLLNKNKVVVGKSILPFEEKVLVEFRENEILNLYYYVKNQEEKTIIEKRINVSPVYLNDIVNVNIFFVEDYKGWKEKEVLLYKDMKSNKINLSSDQGEMAVSLSEIVRRNSIFYRVIFKDGYLDYSPIENYKNLQKDIEALIGGK